MKQTIKEVIVTGILFALMLFAVKSVTLSQDDALKSVIALQGGNYAHSK